MLLNGDRGTLEVGKAADLVAMPSNPLEDTTALYDIDFVMQNGLVIRRPESHY